MMQESCINNKPNSCIPGNVLDMESFGHAVDGRNFAPVELGVDPIIYRVLAPSQVVVWDVFHQQWLDIIPAVSISFSSAQVDSDTILTTNVLATRKWTGNAAECPGVLEDEGEEKDWGNVNNDGWCMMHDA